MKGKSLSEIANLMQYENIKYSENSERWNKNMVKLAVRKGVITAEEFKEITGEVYK